MSFRQTIARYFSDHAETNDVHIDPSLQTHYYKTTSEKGINMLENLFQSDPKYRINAISKDRGEISSAIVKGKKAFLVATVIMVRPYRTAIDFSVTTESMLPVDFGYSYKVIQELYSYADKELPLIENKR
ncbi:cytosolic protein [Lentibacillus salicampi]|uniref:Cytosolic protein n=2 Tax=Lentibacillus salicampi TaxID=175306 RepID=A0A4Y9AE72_9BACI|nr:cytosolic protein [Lentibacillus salicampi]TFJ94116.1 cytosolic protein [Lentibacillus salicampi]